jgi:hypothetical protein
VIREGIGDLCVSGTTITHGYDVPVGYVRLKQDTAMYYLLGYHSTIRHGMENSGA